MPGAVFEGDLVRGDAVAAEVEKLRAVAHEQFGEIFDAYGAVVDEGEAVARFEEGLVDGAAFFVDLEAGGMGGIGGEKEDGEGHFLHLCRVRIFMVRRRIGSR